MKLYEGKRVGGTPSVTVDDRPINPCTDIKNHSPSGLEWAYAGSGPSQLALAIVSDYLEVRTAYCSCDYASPVRLFEVHHEVRCELGKLLEILFRNYQRFKELIVVRLPQKGWTLKEEEVRLCLLELENEHKTRERLKGQ